MPAKKIIEGMPVTAEDEFWLNTLKKITADSIESIENAGKQLISMITVLEGIYTAVIAFSGIKEIPRGNVLASIFYILPILLWLVSLFFALRIFKTQKFVYYSNSPDSAKRTFWEIARRKQRNLDIAYICLCVSFVIAAGGIFYWLFAGK